MAENEQPAGLHPDAPEFLPSFITAPGETDVLMVGMGAFLVVLLLSVGNLYLRLHSLPERMAHRNGTLQFEIVAVLALLALFTHNNLYWVAALLLALVRFPDFQAPLARIAELRQPLDGINLSLRSLVRQSGADGPSDPAPGGAARAAELLPDDAGQVEGPPSGAGNPGAER